MPQGGWPKKLDGRGWDDPKGDGPSGSGIAMPQAGCPKRDAPSAMPEGGCPKGDAKRGMPEGGCPKGDGPRGLSICWLMLAIDLVHGLGHEKIFQPRGCK